MYVYVNPMNEQTEPKNYNEEKAAILNLREKVGRKTFPTKVKWKQSYVYAKY